MGSLYAMRRADGDWFALDDRGGCRVPVFRSGRDGMLARVSHTGMLLFQPAGATTLVDTPFAGLKRGRRVDHAHLAALLRG